jgi:WD40 repeat protein
MSISPCGRDAVLAGRKGLLVIDLDDPFAAPRWLHHETSWEVADVQWSPHSSKPSWVVSTSNQKAMVWNLARSSTNAIEYVLHSHTRAITDIHFHPQNPEMLATCSVDSFVLAWDLRCPKEPVYQWSNWRSAASQVKWNYKDPNIVASSHDSTIQIWDVRKGAMPMKSIEAHDAKINGLDWSRENKYELISCSNDMSVKFWSFDKEYEKPVYTIRSDFPVSKTRHVPFGDHICGIMPLRGGNNSVYMVNYKGKIGEDALDPTYIFKGHTEPVRDFVWRTRHSLNTTIDDREYQLVTWASDKDLRLWPLNDNIYKSLNVIKNQPLKKGNKLIDFEYRSYRPEPYVPNDNKLILRHNRKNNQTSSYTDTARNNNEFNHLNWISGIKIGQSAFQHVDNDPNSATYGDSSSQPLNLGEEFSNVGHKFPKLRFERISVSTGVLVLSLNGPWSSEDKDDLIFIRVEFNFPKGYPSANALPKFKIEETHELKSDKKQEILKNLQEISSSFCSHKRFCLEPCLRYLLGEKVDFDFELEESLDSYGLDFKGKGDEDDEEMKSIGPEISDSESLAANEEEEEEDDDEDEEDINNVNNKKKAAFDSTPVSKGCGAIWTPSGHLVCFFISKETENDQHLIKFGQQGFSLVRNLKRKQVQNGMELNIIDDKTPNNDQSDTDSDSSNDSLSNDFDVFQYDRLYRSKVPDLLRTGNLDSRQYSSNPKSNIMSAPTERSITNTSKTQQSKNVVKIYDFRHLIPVKMELAYEYRVLGDSPHILAEHNAQVAEKYGYTIIANCWKILAIILLKDVIIDEVHATTLLEKFGKDTNNFELLNTYRFYWGFHPFGGTWFVRQVFEYFKKKNDIQMLAMLSCILFENDVHKDNIRVPINLPYASSKTHIESKKSILINGSGTFSNYRNGSIMKNITGGTFNKASPQMIHNPSTVSFNRKYSRSVYSYNPVSSPFNLSQCRMPSVSTLSSYEFDSRSFKSASPAGDIMIGGGMIPSHNRRGIKHQGNASIDYSMVIDSVPNSFVPIPRSMSTTSMNIFNQQFSKTMNLKANVSENESTADNAPVFKIQMQNVNELDLYEDQYCVNIEKFLNPVELREFRSEYASILFCWGLPANRLKILKFNYHSNSIPEYYNKGSDFLEHYGEIGWYDDSKIEEFDIPKVKWEKSHDKNKCNYCQLPVTKRLSVCTKCNHIMHDVCAIEWWEENKMDECPSGCGCECLN